MKKIITSVVTVALLALLAVFGINLYRGHGPRERVQAPDGSKVVIEEMSYYIRGSKMFGKLFRPADGDGNIIDKDSRKPVAVYLHEPLKTDFPVSVAKSLASDGIIGYVSGFRGDEKDIVSFVNRIRREGFAEKDMVFLIGDAATADAVLLAASKLGHKIQGLILMEPNPTGKAREIYQIYGKEFLTVDSSQKGNAIGLMEDYLEERGALK